MFKKLIEKLYYKCYPDRVNEHEIAQMPIPNVKVEQYKIETIQHVKIVPQEAIRALGYDEALRRTKHEMIHDMLKNIEPFVDFRVVENPRYCSYEVWAQLKVVDRRVNV